MELLIDGISRNKELMSDRHLLSNWLLKACEVIEMTPVGRPRVVAYPWPSSADRSALSANCFLAESSIMVHTYPENECVHFDIFSCKDFSVDRIVSFLDETFALVAGAGLLLRRGVDVRSGLVPAMTVISEWNWGGGNGDR
uniref:Putative S-adenosylmethionine decarboxylase n=1 Tax=viral metagenome TaxID=1070528 RepID=A0A6M3JA62_9ZZZZ